MFDRVGAKERARHIMRNDLSACVGAYMFSRLLYFVPFGGPAAEIGLWRYNLDVVRGGRPRASKTLRGFDSFSRALALQLWVVLFMFLWILPAPALFGIGAVIAIFAGGGGGTVIMILLSIVAFLWFIFILFYKGAQYMLSFAILADRPEVTGKQCLDASVELSTPIVGHIIITMLSFIGWLLLSGITYGVAGLLYVFPYVNLTWADIYCQVVPRENWGDAGGRDSRDYPAAPPPPPPPPPMTYSTGGSVRGIAGYYAGYKFPLGDGEALSIGRDSKMAQVVYTDTEDSKKISRLHCTVSFSAARGVYTVTDRSTNGTFRSDGSQLPPGTPAELPRGTTIYLGSPVNSFTLD